MSASEKVIPLARMRDGGAGDVPTGPADDQPDECPVRPIGFANGQFYLMDVAGDLRCLSAAALGRPAELAALFLGDTTWMEQTYPDRRVRMVTVGGESQALTSEAGFSAKAVTHHLMRECHAAGFFGPHIVIRKSGVWLGRDGVPVVHVGDCLLHGGNEYPAGRRVDDVVWVSGPTTARPAQPCSADVGQVFVDRLRQTWNWKDAGGPIVTAGLIAAAYLGGALSWRPSGFIVGPAQSGKTMLMEALHAAVPMARMTNDTTAAGITGMLDGHALPTFIDEASDRNPEGAQKLMDIVLASVSGDGVRGLRGTQVGGVRMMSLLASFIYGSTALPPLGPTHMGRITVIELAPASSGRHGRADMVAFREWCAAHGRALWGRMLARWEALKDAQAVFAAELLRSGCAPREVDQMSAILAGFWVLTQDVAVPAGKARALIGSVRGFVRDAVEVQQDNNPAAAARWLLSRLVQWDSTTRRMQVAELLSQAWAVTGGASDEGGGDARVATDALGRLGMRPIRSWEIRDPQGRPVPRKGDGDGVWLLPVSVAALFQGSDFGVGDRWKTELMRLDGARRSDGNVRVGAAVGKALWLPRSALFEEEPIPWREVLDRFGLAPARLLAMMDAPDDPLRPAQTGDTVEDYLFDAVRVTAWLERHRNTDSG